MNCEQLVLELPSIPHIEAVKVRREFESVVVPLSGTLFGAALKMTRDHAEAEDLVQDTLVRAWRFWDTFQRGTNIKAWMFTILRNTFINGYHRKMKASSFHADVNAQMISLGPGVAVANSTSQPPGPEEVVSGQVTLIKIREALDALPPDYRLAVTLADLDGLSYKEIAEIIECPIGTVMSRIYRGRQILHKLLRSHAIESGLLEEGEPETRMPTRMRSR